MITIDQEAKQIIFQNEYSENETPKPIYRKDLISCYICPKCNEIISAYFKTDVYIKIWEYDENTDRKQSYSSASDLRYYKFRVFHTNGAMGIENKDHNQGYERKCSYRFMESLNLLYGVNGIIKLLNKKFDEEVFAPIDIIKTKEELIEKLDSSRYFELIKDICGRGHPLLHLKTNDINFEETEYWKYDGKEKNRRNKQEEKNKLEAFRTVYSELLC